MMQSHKTAICTVVLAVLSGVLSKDKSAPATTIQEYQDATIPLDVKTTSASDISLVPMVTTGGSRASGVESSTSRTTEVKVDGPTVTPGLDGESKVKGNSSSTKIIDPFSVKLLRAESNGLSVTDVARSKSVMFFNYEQAKAFSADYHYTRKLVYYAAVDTIFGDEVVGRLTRVRPPTVVVSAGVDGPVRLAVDWVHDRLYWLSDQHQTVEVADLNGTNRALLFDNLQDIRFPNNIAVDPYAGYLFLVSNYSVFRADLDGANLTRLELHKEDTRGVKCLALDIRKHRVYYSGKEGNPETGTPYIASCDYEGGSFQDHPLAYKWNDIFALDVFRDTLYFASFKPTVPDKIYTADLTLPRLMPVHLQTVDASRGELWSIRVYHPGVQQDPRGKNCSENVQHEKLGA